MRFFGVTSSAINSNTDAKRARVEAATSSTTSEEGAPDDEKYVADEGKGVKDPTKPKKYRRVPCVRRPVHKAVHCCSAVFHFCTPSFVSFYVIRMIAAGFADPLTEVLTFFFLPVTILFCCGAGCCRLPHCISLWFGIAFATTWVCMLLLNDGTEVRVDGHFDATKRIAVVGGGPSGVTTAYTLAMANPLAQVDLYETNGRFGGHSDTVEVDGKPIDIGFIFSTPNYVFYNAFADRFNVSRVNASITVHYHGDGTYAPWQNTWGGAGTLFTQEAGPKRAQKLAEDIARWNEAATKEKSMLDLFMPLSMYLWFNGYDDDFFHSALVPMLTPLFVTQHGNSAQSAGATLNHFKPKSGFLSFNASDKVLSPEVHHTVGGVQYMYERMVAEMDATVPGFRPFLQSEVHSIAPSAGGWRVTVKNGSSLEYDEVVTACNAHVAEKMLAKGGDGEIDKWPSCDDAPFGRVACRHGYDGIFRALRAWVMRATYYETAEVTLSRSAPGDPVKGESLYHIFDGGVMAGSIDRILDVEDPGSDGDLRLRVAPVNEKSVAPDSNPPIARRFWEHHHFNLWEHILVYRVLPHFNNYDGLHVAGDWTQSVGQDAAIKSGVRAACAVGLNDLAKHRLVEMGIDPGRVKGC